MPISEMSWHDTVSGLRENVAGDGSAAPLDVLVMPQLSLQRANGDAQPIGGVGAVAGALRPAPW